MQTVTVSLTIAMKVVLGYSDIPGKYVRIVLGVNYKGWGFSVMFQGVDHVSRYYDAEAMMLSLVAVR